MAGPNRTPIQNRDAQSASDGCLGYLCENTLRYKGACAQSNTSDSILPPDTFGLIWEYATLLGYLKSAQENESTCGRSHSR